MKETAKTVALCVLGALYVVLALHPAEVPKPVVHEVELAPAFLTVKSELERSRHDLAAAQAELARYREAAAEAAAEKERDARWTAAAEAEARGAVRTASRLYGEYASLYPGTKRAQTATWKAKKLLADLDAQRAAPADAAAPAAGAPAAQPQAKGLGSGAL